MLQNRETYIEPTEVPQTAYAEIAERVGRELITKASAFANPSSKLRAMIADRVRVSSIESHLTAQSVAFHVSNGIEDLGSRIRAYQYIERYRYAFDGMSKEMTTAFIRHTFNLRHHEVYLISERAVKLLAFAEEAGRHFGIETQSTTKAFSKEFNRAMGYRLRERHRTVHSHEAPSMTGRTLDVATGLSASDSDDVRATFVSAINKLIAAAQIVLPSLRRGDIRGFYQDYLLSVDREAADMWLLAASHLRSTLRMG